MRALNVDSDFVRRVALKPVPQAIGGATRLIPSLPTLWPHMLLPNANVRAESLPPPFGIRSARYWYFARNAVWHAANLFDLAGSEMLMPAYFHGVEVDALRAAGVHLVWVRVDRRMQLDLADARAKCTPRTRAIYAIHYAGFPQDLDGLSDLCRERGLFLLEDCALSLLSSHRGRWLGTVGDAAIFCLYKTLPVPNGGALVVKDRDLAFLSASHAPTLLTTASHAASQLMANLELRAGAWTTPLRTGLREAARWMARQRGAVRVSTGTQRFEVGNADLGMSALSDQIIRGLDLAAIVQRRRRNYQRLAAAFEGSSFNRDLSDGVCPLFVPLETLDKSRVLARLLARGISAIDFWRTPHPHGPALGTFPEVDALRETVLELPCHQDLEDEDIDRMIVEVRAAVRG